MPQPVLDIAAWGSQSPPRRRYQWRCRVCCDVRALVRRTRWMSHTECCARHEASHAAVRQPSHERHTRTHVVGIWGTGTGVQHSVERS